MPSRGPTCGALLALGIGRGELPHALRGGLPQDTIDALATELELRLDSVAAVRPDPGHRTFQRLNRAEYRLAPFVVRKASPCRRCG